MYTHKSVYVCAYISNYMYLPDAFHRKYRVPPLIISTPCAYCSEFKIHVFEYANVYVHVYYINASSACTCAHICAHAHKHIHTCMHACIPTYLRTHIHTYIRFCIHARTQRHPYTRARVHCAYLHARMHIRTQIHTCMCEVFYIS